MVAAQKSRGDLERERDSLLEKQAKLQACLNNAPGDRFFASQLDRVGAKLEEIIKLLSPEEKPQPVQEAVREAPKADEALLRQVEREKLPEEKPAPDMDAIMKEVEDIPVEDGVPPEPAAEDPRISRLKEAYESGKISKEFYEKNLKMFREQETPSELERLPEVPPTNEDPRIVKLKYAYETGKISKELYQKSLKRFLEQGAPSRLERLPEEPAQDKEALLKEAEEEKFGKEHASCKAVAKFGEEAVKFAKEKQERETKETKCPFCDSPAGKEDVMCAECGMPLIEEEEDVPKKGPGSREAENTVACMECGYINPVDPKDVKTHDGKNCVGCPVCGSEIEVPNNVLEKAKLAQKNLPMSIAETKKAARAALKEDELFCPACESVISRDNDKCPECWCDLSQYIECNTCGLLTPAGEEFCRECLSPISPDEKDNILMNAYDNGKITKEFYDKFLEQDTPSGLERQGKPLARTAVVAKSECPACGSSVGKQDVVCADCGMPLIKVEESPVPKMMTPEAGQHGNMMLDDPVKKALSNCPAYVVSNDLALRQAGLADSPAGNYVIASHDAISVGSVEPSISNYIPGSEPIKARLYSEHGTDAVSVRNAFGHLVLIKPRSSSPVEANKTPVIFVFGTVKEGGEAGKDEKGMFKGFFSRSAKTEAQPEKAFIMWYLPCVGVDQAQRIASAHGVVFFNLRDLDEVDRSLKRAKTTAQQIEAVRSSMDILNPHAAYVDMRDNLHDPDATLESLYAAFPHDVIDFYKQYFLSNERVVVNLE